jgi:post-segregation antitoxin (ccd killing protein)
MTRVNVHLPDALAEEARAAGLNVSKVAQDALRRVLAGRRTSAWLDQLRRLSEANAVIDASALVDLLPGGETAAAVRVRLEGVFPS